MDPLKLDRCSCERTAHGSITSLIIATLLALFVLSGCAASETPNASEGSPSTSSTTASSASVSSLDDVPDYFGQDYLVLNNDQPEFTEADFAVADGTEEYGQLDSYGRATYAFAKLCTNTRPAPGSKRAKNMPDPSGWVQAYYPEIGLDHLYERSHLIAYSLSDEAVNPRDLITGTEHLNQDTMQEFEGAIRSYLDSGAGSDTKHVLMRVTPDFRGTDLVARGVQIEAYSLEDEGASVCFNVYCYNIQPRIEIDYATGASRLATTAEEVAEAETAAAVAATEAVEQAYVLNTNTKKFHYPTCDSVADMKAKNRKDETTTRSALIESGYTPCSRCDP
ncbi:DNA/RNA non-specific endonuclease [Anaerotardibacter muris]|uniref:DNA/RNA non-specific endonuclease n=1 Tax=Anaerotardibacter muris TaxID=2941505 RepID=UPI0020411C0F|nr:DNA/RNA non-specific endonuclease [Anaerotardibacter muris]